MTYDEFIQNIINTRGQWNIPDGEYFEMHHIIPICIGGLGDYNNNKFRKRSHHPNCIWLTAKEHFIAHKLLAEENINIKVLLNAFVWMCHTSKENTYISSAEEYEDYKLLIRAGQSRPGKLNGMYGKKRTDAEKLKIKQTRIKKQLAGEYINSYKKIGLAMSKKNIKCKWYNNGRIEKFCVCQPEGFVVGRLLTQGFKSGGSNPAAKICQVFDINGVLIKEFPSGRDAERYLNLRKGIIKATIASKRKTPLCGKYYFSWKDTDNEKK